MLEACERLTAIDPGNRDWQVYLGLAHNNLAKMALLSGDLGAAIAGYKADLNIELALARKDPQDNNQAEKVLISTATLGRTLALTGETDAGIAHLRQALVLVDRLLEMEPKSTAFQEDAGLYSTQLARLLRTKGDLAGADALSGRAASIFEAMTQKDAGNTGWQRELAETKVERAEQSLALGRPDVARAQAESALAILEPQLAERAEDRAIVLATISAWLLVAATSTDAAAATKLREQALQTAMTQDSGKGDPRLLAQQVHALLALERKSEVTALLPMLWTTGYRDPGFLALLSRKKMPLPATNIATTNRP